MWWWLPLGYVVAVFAVFQYLSFTRRFYLRDSRLFWWRVGFYVLNVVVYGALMMFDKKEGSGGWIETTMRHGSFWVQSVFDLVRYGGVYSDTMVQHALSVLIAHYMRRHLLTLPWVMVLSERLWILFNAIEGLLGHRPQRGPTGVLPLFVIRPWLLTLGSTLMAAKMLLVLLFFGLSHVWLAVLCSLFLLSLEIERACAAGLHQRGRDFLRSQFPTWFPTPPKKTRRIGPCVPTTS